jgi:acyl-CoA dehydrogenase
MRNRRLAHGPVGALEESGFAVAAAPEDLGGAGAGWDDLYVVVRAAGRHALPLPLPEALLANHLLARCGLQARNEALSIAPRAELTTARLAGSVARLHDVPWGRHAAGVLAIVGSANPPWCCWTRSRPASQPSRTSPASPRRPGLRQRPCPLASAPCRQVCRPTACGWAAPCCAARRAPVPWRPHSQLSVQYATERVQFGKPIAAFQAIQHQLAVMAEQAGCAPSRPKPPLSNRWTSFSPFAIATAKVMRAEAAGVVAGMAHAVHGAIGFTHEHALQHLTRRLWSWRSEFGNLGHWSQRLGQAVCAGGAAALWPAITSGQLELPPADEADA